MEADSVAIVRTATVGATVLVLAARGDIVGSPTDPSLDYAIIARNGRYHVLGSRYV